MFGYAVAGNVLVSFMVLMFDTLPPFRSNLRTGSLPQRGKTLIDDQYSVESRLQHCRTFLPGFFKEGPDVRKASQEYARIRLPNTLLTVCKKAN
jgi:hypothetical protein